METMVTEFVYDNDAFETAHELAKFPDEAWTMVFNSLGDSSKNLLNCSRVCKKWARILKAKECTWLFDQVFPPVLQYLPKRDILTLRQICKQWRSVVDGWLESQPSRQTLDDHPVGDVSYSILKSKKLQWTCFFEKEPLARFMNLMGPCQSNPIIGRSLWLEFQEETDLEDEDFRENSEYWPTAFQFLSCYGRHILYFTFATYGTKNTNHRFLYLLKTCLTYMPNLKSLHIFGWINESGEDPENLLPIEDIPNYLERNPLPLLNFLESVEINNMSGLPVTIQDYILSQHSGQLKCLQLSEWADSCLVDIEVPQLKELAVEVLNYRQTIMKEKVHRLLNHLTSCFIDKLTISFASLESDLDLPCLFDLIGKLGDTLRSLRLSVIPGSPMDKKKVESYVALRINSPHLRSLHLEGFYHLPLQFLTNLSSLEYFELRPLSRTVRQHCYQDEVINLYQYLQSNAIYDSNIWTLLPKLKKMYCETCVLDAGQLVYKFFTGNRVMYDYLVRHKYKSECVKNLSS